MREQLRRYVRARAAIVAGAALWLVGAPRSFEGEAVTPGSGPVGFAVTVTSTLALVGLLVIGLAVIGGAIRGRRLVGMAAGATTLTGLALTFLPSTLLVQQREVSPLAIGFFTVALASILYGMTIARPARFGPLLGGIALAFLALGFDGGLAINAPHIAELLSFAFGVGYLIAAYAEADPSGHRDAVVAPAAPSATPGRSLGETAADAAPEAVARLTA